MQLDYGFVETGCSHDAALTGVPTVSGSQQTAAAKAAVTEASHAVDMVIL